MTGSEDNEQRGKPRNFSFLYQRFPPQTCGAPDHTLLKMSHSGNQLKFTLSASTYNLYISKYFSEQDVFSLFSGMFIQEFIW